MINRKQGVFTPPTFHLALRYKNVLLCLFLMLVLFGTAWSNRTTWIRTQYIFSPPNEGVLL
jgi:hypothetical protein